VEREISEASSEQRAEASIVWLLAWSLVLPFAHPRRLLSYGLPALILLTALTALYPSASVFAPILVTSNFEPQPPQIFLSQGPTLGVIVLILSGLIAAFMICIWQRDVLHRFREPIGALLTTSLGRLFEHLVASLLLAGFLLGFAALLWRTGPIGLAIGCLVLAPIYARLAFLGPIIVSLGFKDALPRARSAGRGHAIGHALVYAILALCWYGTLFLVGQSGVMAATREQSLLPMLLADCAEVMATFFFVLWIAAVPALIVRRRIALQGIDARVFD
jgi:hypothetical protein